MSMDETLCDPSNENELAIIDGIPATAFHKSIVQLPPFRSFPNHLQFPSSPPKTPPPSPQSTISKPAAKITNSISVSPNKDNINDIHQSLYNDCHVAFTARPKESNQAYSSGSTYFIPCQMKPRCLLEALALDIFHAHTNQILEQHCSNPSNQKKKGSWNENLFDPERSGAEWWTLVMDALPPPTKSSSSSVSKKAAKTSISKSTPMKFNNSNDSSSSRSSSNSSSEEEEEEEDEEEDDVGMHFDADYGLEDVFPALIHPPISTITYLSPQNMGVPTLVLKKKSPPPEDSEKKSLNGSIGNGFLSFVEYGKHVAFDGRLLHGASALFFQSIKANCNTPNTEIVKEENENRNGKRITFLVNIWYNHVPIDADLAPNDIVQQMTPCHHSWQYKNPIHPMKKFKSETNNPSAKSPSSISPPPYIFPPLNNPEILPSVPITFSSKERDQKEVQTVICGRDVTLTFQSNFDTRKLQTKMNTNEDRNSKSSSVELVFEKECLVLHVGEEVVYTSEEDEKEEEES